MRASVERRIRELARRQHGVVSRRQLLEMGVEPGAVRHAVRMGRFERVHRGVYRVGPIRSHRARAIAAILACGGAAVSHPKAVGSIALVSHRSAAELWKLLPKRGEREPVHVTVAGGFNEDRPGIRVRRVRRLDPDERGVRSGIPVTSPGRTLVDLARDASSREVEQAVARAQRENLLGPDDLTGLLVRYGGRAGTRALRSVLRLESGPALTRSEAEARFLRLIRDAKLPVPEANARIAGCEVDFLWRAQRIAVEVNGYRFHGSRPSFERDHRRTTHLAAHGVQVIPVTWRQIVEDGVVTAVQLARALFG